MEERNSNSALGIFMNWYKTAQSNYPYYIAVYYEGRLKGQYPPSIGMIPDMKRKWDRGDFGTGKTMVELKDTTIQDLIGQLRAKGKDPRFDDVDFYIVRKPNSPREGIHYSRLIDMMRSEK